MAKKKSENGTNGTTSDPVVVSIAADGHSSVRFKLSSGETVIAIVAGGENFNANARNRDLLVAAAQRLIKLPEPA